MSDGPERSEEEQYQAPYYEFFRAEFVSNLEDVLRKIVPFELNVGSEDERGDIRFRFFSLPEDPQEREKRLEEIRQQGSDRTDSSLSSRYNILYERAAQKAGVQPIDVIDTMNAIDFRRHSQALLQPPQETHLGANGILVYDAKTDKGIKNIEAVEYTFKDLSNRRQALLAIIGLK